MAYTKTSWTETVPITAERLNKIEKGVEDSHNQTDSIRSNTGTLKVELRTTDPDPLLAENEGRIYLRTDL